ncbi:uncharacterized protein LOC110467000 [Mizuhopecten yessoensis]|uniref:uncharacterized protein LOC110467000 n=1 Tax=Mizuhopecten yessoensis TaxID=6573 RepID=UPI000B45A29E|nr:uncharacterized protein LOC110467000 [Mizuhopecten yessoensis]
MDCGYDHEPEPDPMFEGDTALGSIDEVSGFLNQLVDQSITDLIKQDITRGEFQDEELPLPGLKEKKMKQKEEEFATSKSLPCLNLKQMDGIPKSTSTPMQKTSSLPSVRQIKPSPVRVDNWDMRRNTLIRQYQKAMIDSHVYHMPSVIQGKPETGSRPVTLSDLAVPQSPAKIPQVISSGTNVIAQDNNMDDNIEEMIGEFVSESLLSITNEKADQGNEMQENSLDDQVDDFIATSLSSIVSNTESLQAEREMEKEIHEDEEGHSVKLTATSVVSKAEREMEKEIHEDEEGHSLKLTATFVVSKAEREMEKEIHEDEEGHSLKLNTATSVVSEAEREMEEKLNDTESHSVKRAPTSLESVAEKGVAGLSSTTLDMTKPSLDIGSERKPSSSSIFGLLFKRRKSNGSRKLKFPCFGFVFCTVPQDVDEDAGDSGCSSKINPVKKPGFLKRLFPCLRRRGARVAPL